MVLFPLILTGLGCAVAFRTGFLNIGAEGQFYIGAMAGTACSLSLPVQGIANIFLSLLAGLVAGGLWALIAALLKSRFGISEIIYQVPRRYYHRSPLCSGCMVYCLQDDDRI